jgi:predicted aconitase with swiveling domain
VILLKNPFRVPAYIVVISMDGVTKSGKFSPQTGPVAVMNNVIHGKNANGKVIALEDVRHPDADYQVLQEIIDILKYSFETSCKF